MVQLYRRQGADTLVNTQTQFDQAQPDVAVLPGGGYVVVWLDESLTGGDSSGTSIKAQLFNSAGQGVAPEFLVNATVTGNQTNAQVAALPSGRFVVTWTDWSATGADTSSFAVRGRLFEAGGAPVGGEFLINTVTSGTQSASAVTALAGGGFAVSWSDNSGTGNDTSGFGIKAQLFDSSGAKVGGEIAVNSTTAGTQNNSSIAGLPSGGFAVSWISTDPASVGTTRVQLFDSSGAKLGSEIQVNGTGGSGFKASNIAALADGFIVSWTQNSGDFAQATDVRAQRFDFNGNKLGAEFVVHTALAGYQELSDAVALPGGGFLITWHGPDEANAGDVFAQIFDSAGGRVGSEFVVSNIVDGQQLTPRAAAKPSGEIILVWADSSGAEDHSDFGVKSQVLTPSAAPTTDIALSAMTLNENAVENIAVATLSASRAVNSAFAYQLLADSTGGAFRIDGDRLVVDDNARLDFETAPQVTVTIRATDIDGHSYDEAFVLNVTDIVQEKRLSATGELRVNVNESGAPGIATVVPLAGGGFAMLWKDSNPPSGTSPDSLLLRLYNSAGEPQSGEIVIAGPFTSNLSIAPLANGGFVITREAFDPSTLQNNARAQAYDTAGNKVGAEMVAGTFSSNSSDPVLVQLTNGDFVVAWQAGYGELRGQRFGPAGTAIGGEFTITRQLSEDEVSLVATPNGGFAVSWIDFDQTAGEGRVQFYDSSNVPVQTLVVEIGTDPRSLSLIALADGSYLLGWMERVDQGFDLEAHAVKAQRIGADRAAIGGPILLADAVDYANRGIASFAANPLGGFVATWAVAKETVVGGQVTYYFADVEGRLFDSSGSPVGPEFQVATMTSSQTDVGILADGSVVVAWSAPDGDASGSFARVYRAANEPAANSSDDVLTGDANSNLLDGGGGNDRLYGLGGNDDLRGGSGNDALDGGSGADRMEGGPGNDSYLVDNQGDIVVELVDAGADTVATSINYTLTANVENLQALNIGGTDPLLLTGNALNNFIWGTQGNNAIDGGGGADFMIGYAGNDFYHVDHVSDIAYELEGGGADTVATVISYTLAANIENLQSADIAGTAALALTGNATNNFIWGTQGNNIMDGAGGADFLIGYAGDDIYHVDNVSDIAYELEGGGSDTAVASISYTLAANVENLQALNIAGTAQLALTGNAMNNFIWATQGNNVIDGAGGADFMIGYGGNDFYFVDDAGDVTIEEAGGGEDTVAALASYALGANIENLQAANIGGSAALSLTGNEQSNFIWGTQGANVIAGRGGNDRIYGYGGADQFLFNTAAGNANFDWLDDFQAGVDKIVLDNSVFTALVDGALPSSAFVAGTSAADADDRIIFNAADGSVFYDADGNGAGAALLIAYIPVGQPLTAADFQVM